MTYEQQLSKLKRSQELLSQNKRNYTYGRYGGGRQGPVDVLPGADISNVLAGQGAPYQNAPQTPWSGPVNQLPGADITDIMAGQGKPYGQHPAVMTNPKYNPGLRNGGDNGSAYGGGQSMGQDMFNTDTTSYNSNVLPNNQNSYTAMGGNQAPAVTQQAMPQQRQAAPQVAAPAPSMGGGAESNFWDSAGTYGQSTPAAPQVVPGMADAEAAFFDYDGNYGQGAGTTPDVAQSPQPGMQPGTDWANVMGAVGSGVGAASGLYGMYNQHQGMKLAERQVKNQERAYADQKQHNDQFKAGVKSAFA